MIAFVSIMNKILNINNNIFFCKSDNIDTILKLSFHTEFNKSATDLPVYKQKFIYLKNILNSFMIKKQREEEIIFYFNKIQYKSQIILFISING